MKRIILIFLLCLIIISNYVVADENDDREWKLVGTWGPFHIHALGPTSYPTDIVVLTWDGINQTYKNSILFDLTFIPKYPIQGRYFENIEYFVEGQEINAIKLYIDKIDRDTVLYNASLTIIRPDGTIFRNISFLEENHTGTNTMKVKLLDNEPLIFNETGIWKIHLRFEASTKNLIWKYISGYGLEELYQTFKLTESLNPELEDITFYNEYREAIPVITLSQALEVTNMAYISLQTEYLNSTASSLMESSESTRQTAIIARDYVKDSGAYNSLMIFAAFTLAIANIFLVGVNWLLYSENKKLVKQNQDETSAWGTKGGSVASKLDVYTAIRDMRDILRDRLPKEKPKRRRNKPKKK